MTRSSSYQLWTLGLLILLLLTGCSRSPQPGQVQDEAKLAGRSASSFPAADEDYFHDMDGGITLTGDEIKGRDMWLVWTGGNDRFWDHMSVASVGTLDFLKTVSSYPNLKFSRAIAGIIWDWSMSRVSRRPRVPIRSTIVCGWTNAGLTVPRIHLKMRASIRE